LLKQVIIIILVILAIGTAISTIFIAYEYQKATGDHQILLLIVDTDKSGVGAVDMAFVVPMVHYGVTVMTPVYPNQIYQANNITSAEVQQQGVEKRSLPNETLWSNKTQEQTKLIQKTIEYNTGIKTDVVVIMTPAAINAMINAVGPIYTDELGYVDSKTVNSLLKEQNLSITRDYSVYSVMRALMETYHNPLKRPALLLDVANQYLQGNIVVIPKELFLQLGIASGTNKLN